MLTWAHPQIPADKARISTASGHLALKGRFMVIKASEKHSEFLKYTKKIQNKLTWLF